MKHLFKNRLMRLYTVSHFKKILFLFFCLSLFLFPHSGRTDSSGGHDCGAESKAKELCTGYHYHNDGIIKTSQTQAVKDKYRLTVDTQEKSRLEEQKKECDKRSKLLEE